MVNDYGISDFTHRTLNSRSSCLVLDRGTDGDLCGSSDPDCYHGYGSGDGEAGDCSMVAPELEDCFSMDEILSDIVSISADGDYISGYLRFSLKGTS